jgi:hypothetical protein
MTRHCGRNYPGPRPHFLLIRCSNGNSVHEIASLAESFASLRLFATSAHVEPYLEVKTIIDPIKKMLFSEL